MKIKKVLLIVVTFGLLLTAPGAFSKTIDVGFRGEEVRRAQILLQQIPGFYPKKAPANGYFGFLTRQAIKRFQKQYGLPIRGRLDQPTLDLLDQVATRLKTSATVLGSTGSGQTGGRAKTEELPPPAFATLLPLAPPSTALPEKPYFSYQWRADNTLTGEVQLPTPAPRPVFVVEGATKTILPTGATIRLATIYNILLVDDEEKWNEEGAALLLNTLERLPKTPFESWAQPDQRPWQLTLSAKPLLNDIEIKDRQVKIYRETFARSNPLLESSTSGADPRVFYSNRLFKAVLRIFYNDRNLLTEIMRINYGVGLGLGKPQDEFQEFATDELVYLASVMEDLPSGFHNMPGLEKIVRRKSGLTNPDFPQAAAIAWIDRGYMEFMDGAFHSGSAAFIQKIIAHEMTHFLWAKVLSAETHQAFMDLSGWSRTPGPKAIRAIESVVKSDDPQSTYAVYSDELWYRTATTNFMTAYAAAYNPDEDFAETIAHYIYQPDLVRTLAPEKYNFIKEVVDGYEYVTLVDKKFTFQVFDLEPDVTFPGKIIGVDTEVYKLESGDNRIVANLYLAPSPDTGTVRAFARLVSKEDTFIDQYFVPVPENPFLLRADFIISQYAAGGYWIPEQITVTDEVGNKRYESQTHFGWMLLIENPNEDLEPPEVDTDEIWGVVIDHEGDKAIQITIPITDKNPEGLGARGSVVHYDSGQQESWSMPYDPIKKRVVFVFPIRRYRASGDWTFREFWVYDKASNEKRYDLGAQAITLRVNTAAPDHIKPTLDINSIKIEATPRRPEAPDGETDVKIWYKAKDDNAGLGIVAYTLLAPNGQALFDYHYHDNFFTPYFVGNAQELKEYKIERTLPPGSAPGTWILREIVLYDKAGNVLTSNFVEIGIVKPFKIF